ASCLRPCHTPPPLAKKPFPAVIDENPFVHERIQSWIGPETVVGERFARDQMPVKVLQVHRLGAHREGHAEAITGVLFGTAHLASVGVSANIFLDQLRVGAEAAGGKNRRASAQFGLCAVLLGDQACDTAVLDDEPHTFAAIQVASAEIQELFLEARESTAADVLLIDRAVGDFARLVEPNSSRCGLFDLDTDSL